MIHLWCHQSQPMNKLIRQLQIHYILPNDYFGYLILDLKLVGLNILEDLKIVGNTITNATWGLVIQTATDPGSRPTINNIISNVEISRNTIQNVVHGINLGTIGTPSSLFSSDEINGNILDSVLLKNNLIEGWQRSDISVNGPVTNLVIE